MPNPRFTTEHYASNDKQRRAAENGADAGAECSATATVMSWVHEAAERAPATVCLTSFAVGVGVGALLVHACLNASCLTASGSQGESTLLRAGKRAMDSLVDAIPSTFQAFFRSRF